MVSLTAGNVALGSAGLFPALGIWLMLVMALLIINFGIRALGDRRRALRRARLMLWAAAVALVDVGTQSYFWATNVLQASSAPGVNSVLASAFQGFGSGLWVIVSGLLAALTGGALLHGAARSPGRNLPLPESALAIASFLALVGSGALAVGIAPSPSLATLTFACRGANGAAMAASPQSLYATAEDTIYALRPGDGVVRWQCQNSFVTLQTAGPPTLSKGIIYVAALDGTVFAVRADDGTLLWHHLVAIKGPSPLVSEGFGAPALVVANGAVYGKDGTGGVFALRAADGDLLWHNSSLGLYPEQVGAPLVVADGVIFAALGYSYQPMQGLFALDAHTGALLWRTSSPTLQSTPFTVAGERIYDEEIEAGAAAANSYLVARATSDGAVLWRYPLAVSPPGTSLLASPFTLADGIIYLQTYEPDESPQILKPVIRALRAADGTLLWSFDPNITPVEGQTFGGNGLAFVAGTVYAAVSTFTGCQYVVDLYAVSARDGSRLWHARPFSPGLSICPWAAPSPIAIVVAGGTSYFVLAGRNLAAIDTRDGSVLWTYFPLRGPQSLIPLSAPVVVSGDLVYLAANRLYALNTRDGSVRWQLAPPLALSSQSISRVFTVPVLGP
jgi:outer membrane protein assembly factor BamB